jgi:hypothetical protein
MPLHDIETWESRIQKDKTLTQKKAMQDEITERRAAMAAAQGADVWPTPPEGWQWAPIEPTPEMAKASGISWEWPPFPARYKAMMEVAPQPIQSDSEGYLSGMVAELSRKSGETFIRCLPGYERLAPGTYRLRAVLID